jgi:hypothetical protein
VNRFRLVLLGGALAVLCAALAGPIVDVSDARARSHSPGTRVTVRVEGAGRTLLLPTTVDAVAKPIDPDGKRADTCEGDTVAVALQDATHGHWTAGKYYSGLGYPVEGILGESHPFSSPYYWALWLDGKPSTAGICTAKLHAGEQILFFPACSKESASACPQGLFDPPVLDLSGPARARAGKAFTVRVRSLAFLDGRASPGAGVKVRAGARTLTTDSSGTARVRFAKRGRYRIVASASGAIRDELTVTVR